MALVTKTAQDIFAPADNNGQPRAPSLQEVQVWGTEIENVATALATASAAFDTRANLYSSLGYSANTMAWVVADTTVAYNGIYRKSGASGSGAWSRVADLPYSFIVATNAGAGTANAIIATTSIPVSESALVILPIAATNTASPVRVSYNGGSLLTIKSNNGNDIVIGGLAAGMHVTGVIVGDVFQLVSDQVSAAIAAAAEASAQASQASANNAATQVTNARAWSDQAQAYAATANPINFVPIRPNLCPNGGLESGLDGISLWNNVDGYYNNGNRYDSPMWGAVLSIGLTSGATTYRVQWPKFPVSAGSTYTVTGDAVLFATAGNVFYQLVWLDAAGVETYGSTKLLGIGRNFSDTATARQDMAVASVAPAGTVQAYVRCVFDALTAPAALQVRQCKVEHGTIPASFYSQYVPPITRMIEVYPEMYGVSTSNTAALNDIGWARVKAAIEAMSGSYGVTIRFRAGLYRFTSLPWPNRHCTRILGAGHGLNGTILEFASTSGLPNPITITGLQHCAIRDVYIRQSIRVAGYAIVLDGAAYVTTIERVRIDYSHNGIWVKHASETVLRDIEYRYLIGSYGTRCGGATGGCYGVTFDNVRGDNPYRPNLEPKVKKVGTAVRVNWQPTQAYVAGEITVANNAIWQCVVAGTTGSTFSPAIPGTTPTDAFTTNVTDGTVQWAFISLNNLAWCVQDSFAYSLRLDKLISLNGSQGFAMRDTLATGSSYPMWCLVGFIECDHNHAMAINLEAGEGFYTSLVWAGSCLTGNGITIGSGFRGEVALNNGTRVHGNWQHGILLNPGPVATSIIGVQVSNNSQENVGVYHGIAVVGGSTDFTILGCGIGVSAHIQVSQGYSIFIGGGCSYGRVALNRLRGASVANIDQGTGHNDVQFSMN